MYIIASEKKNKKGPQKRGEESFINMGKPKQNHFLPNTHIPPENYPKYRPGEYKNPDNSFSNPNEASSEYFNQNAYEKRVEQGKHVTSDIQNIYSLTGNYLDSKEFKHNNMVPFYGGKIKGFTYDTQLAETILDNKTGSGSQTIKKIEQAPLFKPENHINWTYGAPNNSDFYQSRMNPATKNHNVKPFATERVGPGLNQGGSGTMNAGGGNGGANTGGGGGANGINPSAGLGGNGGSGIVVIRVPIGLPVATVTGTCSISTYAAAYRTYKFTGSGTIKFN
jgi:hypothetical protein